uniref:Uncharacterized protein n=1 Tax=Romanomermis culicivorax TaxID=13658 RepID=A0A915I327_ROMCU
MARHSRVMQGLVCLALIDWTAAGCAGDYNCKYNERCFSDSNTCEVAENVNHQEGVKCYLDSYCKSQYKCENWACYFKGKTYEHLSDTKDVKGACTHDDECPDDYYCRMDRHTCYKRSSSFKETECQPDSWCKDNYHCCHDQKCENHQCVAAPASEGRHIKDVTCSYNFHCPSEYTCKNYTCYYSGEE